MGMDTKMDDDLYKNDGATYTNGVYYPEVPAEQVEDEAKARGILASSYPVMDDVAEWFKQSIADCDSISNIEIQAMTVHGVKYTREVSVQAQVLAYQLLKQALEDKAKEFSEFGEGRS